jgi:hypothetical protein
MALGNKLLLGNYVFSNKKRGSRDPELSKWKGNTIGSKLTVVIKTS